MIIFSDDYINFLHQLVLLLTFFKISNKDPVDLEYIQSLEYGLFSEDTKHTSNPRYEYWYYLLTDDLIFKKYLIASNQYNPISISEKGLSLLDYLISRYKCYLRM